MMFQTFWTRYIVGRLLHTNRTNINKFLGSRLLVRKGGYEVLQVGRGIIYDIIYDAPDILDQIYCGSTRQDTTQKDFREPPKVQEGLRSYW